MTHAYLNTALTNSLGDASPILNKEMSSLSIMTMHVEAILAPRKQLQRSCRVVFISHRCSKIVMHFMLLVIDASN